MRLFDISILHVSELSSAQSKRKATDRSEDKRVK